MGKENNQGMDRRQFLGLGAIASAGLLMGLRPTESARAQEVKPKSEHEFVRALHPNVKLFSDPDIKAPYIADKVLDTYPADYPVPSPRYIINTGTTLRVKPMNSEWAEVLKQNETYNPFVYRFSDNKEHEKMYVQLKDFELIPELKSIDFLEGTKLSDKEIVVIHTPKPHIILIEQDEIVCFAPTILGGAGKPTPFGNFQISQAGITTHMMTDVNVGFPGVPFPLRFKEKKPLSLYLHEAWWWENEAWSDPEFSRYGSHGCINLQSEVARLLFQWSLDHFSPFDQKHDEFAKALANESLHLSVVAGAAALKNVKRANPDRNWDKILAQYAKLREGEWIVPNLS